MSVASRILGPAVTGFALLGCIASSPTALESPAQTNRPTTIAAPATSTPDLTDALATIAAAGVDLGAPLEPWPSLWCAELISLEPDALLESLVVVTHYDRDPDRRRAALHQHIRVRLGRCDLRGAASLLEAYLLEDATAPDAVWTAVLLTDVLTLVWLQAREPSEVLAAREQLGAWLVLAPSLAMWTHPDAAALRRGVVGLRANLVFKSCRSDGSIYCDGVHDPLVELYERCADAFDELARQHPDFEDVEALRHNASELREASEQPGPCARP